MVGRRKTFDKGAKNCVRPQEKQKKASSSSSMVNRFVKIMFGKDHTEVLYLPPKFARTVRDLVGQQTQIKNSNGDKWRVKFSNVDGSLTFKEGWLEFFRENYLELGDILIFNYARGSHFDVCIFERKSGCERTDFTRGKARNNKRSKKNPEIVPQDEPFQTIDVNNVDKPGSALPVSMKNPEIFSQDKQFPIVDVNTVDEPLPTTQLALGSEFENNVYKPGSAIPMSMENPEIFSQDKHFQLIDVNRVDEPMPTTPLALGSEFENNVDKPGSATPMCMGNPEIFSQDKQFQITDVNTMDEPMPTTPFALGSKFENTQSKIMNTNAPFSGSYFGISANVEDLSFMLNRNVGYNEREDRNFLYDLSNFEMKKIESDGDKFKKTNGEDPQLAAIQMNQIDDHSNGIFIDMYNNKPSGNGNSRIDMPDMTKYRLPIGGSGVLPSDIVSPFIGSSRAANAEQENAFVPKYIDSSAPSTLPYTSSGVKQHAAIKKELLDSREKPVGFPKLSNDAGKKPTLVMKFGQTSSPAVKTEPNSPYNMVTSSVTARPFSVEVKSQSYLELPVSIPSNPRERESGQGKVVNLRDSSGRLWPVIYPEIYFVRALTVNWRSFCEANRVELGDTCFFQLEDRASCVYRVDIMHKSADSSTF